MATKVADVDLLDAQWNDRREIKDMPKHRLKVKYQEVDRSMPRGSKAPNPSFDNDEQVEVFFQSLFRMLWKFWDPDHIKDGKLHMPRKKEFQEMLEKGGPDNDLYSSIVFYLIQFFPFAPEDDGVEEILLKYKREGLLLPIEDVMDVARHILKEHQV